MNDRDFLGEERHKEILNRLFKIQETLDILLSKIEEKEEDAREDDELYEEARKIVIESGKATTSHLQRRLRIGYARAARLIDLLEEEGVIGPQEGATPRQILMRENL